MKYLTATVTDFIENSEWCLTPDHEVDMSFLSGKNVDVIGFYPEEDAAGSIMAIILYKDAEGNDYVYNLSPVYLDTSAELIVNTFNPVKKAEFNIPLTTSSHFLNEAKKVQDERGKEYQKTEGERSFKQAADAFNAITGKDLSGSEVALLLQVLKDVRQWQNPNRVHEDSLLDCVSYAALKAEEVVNEVNQKEPF